jgi:hypothetical protein
VELKHTSTAISKKGGKFIEISLLVGVKEQTCFDHIQRNLHGATENFSKAHFLPALTDHIADESAIVTGLICSSHQSIHHFIFRLKMTSSYLNLLRR